MPISRFVKGRSKRMYGEEGSSFSVPTPGLFGTDKPKFKKADQSRARNDVMSRSRTMSEIGNLSEREISRYKRGRR